MPRVTLNPALDMNCSVRQAVAERRLRCGPSSRDQRGGGLNVARAMHELGSGGGACGTCAVPMGASSQLFSAGRGKRRNSPDPMIASNS